MPARRLTESERLGALGPRPQSTWRGDLAAFAAFLVWAAAMFVSLLALGE